MTRAATCWNTRWIKALLQWLSLHPVWRAGRVRVWGNQLRPPNFDRWLALWLHRLGLIGMADRGFIEAHVNPGMTVVDIGANQGLYTLLFSRLTGESGRVLAFEPDDLLHGALTDNLAFNRAGNVQPFHLALGVTRGEMTLYRSLLNSGDNRLSAKAAGEGPRQAVPVQIERLDAVLAGQRIDFVKMDVQGWEMEVLRGMQGLLDAPANARMAIYFEFWPKGLRDAGNEPAEPLAFLIRNGFTIHSLRGSELAEVVADPSGLARTVSGSAYINLFAIRRAVDPESGRLDE